MFERINHIHLIGIGGIGMSALAKYFLAKGKIVSGSDLHRSDLTDDLERRGVIFYQGHDASHLSDSIRLVVYSPAIPTSNFELLEGKKRGLLLRSYPEVLGELSKEYSTVVVTGTHGKSTTTAMLGLILSAAGYDPTVIVGSLVPGFEMGNIRVGRGRFLVLEGCEHQANMLNLHPEMIVLTSIEADHLDYYKTLENIREAFQTFVGRLSGKGMVIVNADDAVSQTLQINNRIAYGTHATAHYQYSDRSVSNGNQHVRIRRTVPNEELGELVLRVPGSFNVFNALGALAAAMELGVPFQTCVRVLESFPGLWRRFERLGLWHGVEMISDYGHHPTAIRVTLAAARELFPQKKIIFCFQPHQHSRTRALFSEFVDALSGADELVLMEIYRVEGRTEDESVSSQELAEAMMKKRSDLRVRLVKDFQEATLELTQAVEQWPDSVVIIQGAGNIDDLARKIMQKQ